MELRVPIPRRQIEGFCRRWKITELSVFGSVLREDFGPQSDVDVLVTFAPEAHWTLFDMARMRDELSETLPWSTSPGRHLGYGPQEPAGAHDPR